MSGVSISVIAFAGKQRANHNYPVTIYQSTLTQSLEL
jgi:hypothetical protein